jgi:hypothetical protein
MNERKPFEKSKLTYSTISFTFLRRNVSIKVLKIWNPVTVLMRKSTLASRAFLTGEPFGRL